MSRLSTRRLRPFYILAGLLLAWQSIGSCWAGSPFRRFRIMTYNVENLFDTIHAEGKLDEDFTPTGKQKWDSRKYWWKQGQLRRVIAGVGGVAPVDLVALVEVENDSVLKDLTERTKLRRLGYRYTITHGEDARGINVALLYQPHRFKLCRKDSIRIPPVTPKQRQTRDILHITGELVTGDTLDLLICHLPSRREERIAERYRERIMQRLKAYTDSLFCTRQKPLVIMTGDFNAWYPERCFKRDLNVLIPHPSTPAYFPIETGGRKEMDKDTDLDTKQRKEKGKAEKTEAEQGQTMKPDNDNSPHGEEAVSYSYLPNRLYLLTHEKEARYGIKGTYKFQGQWNQLDHFIVSGNLLHYDLAGENGTPKEPRKRSKLTKPNTPFTTVKDCRIVDYSILLKKEKSGIGYRPKRTFLGTYHQGGFSDHLPLILDLYY